MNEKDITVEIHGISQVAKVDHRILEEEIVVICPKCQQEMDILMMHESTLNSPRMIYNRPFDSMFELGYICLHCEPDAKTKKFDQITSWVVIRQYYRSTPMQIEKKPSRRKAAVQEEPEEEEECLEPDHPVSKPAPLMDKFLKAKKVME